MRSLTILFVGLLHGCSVNFAEDVESRVTAARKSTDPWSTRNSILEAVDIGKRCEDYGLGPNRCALESKKQKLKYEAEIARYTDIAVQQAHPAAIKKLYHEGGNNDLFAKHGSLVIKKAEDNTQHDGEVVRIAGLLISNGIGEKKDTRRAVALFARSWALGVPEAAANAATEFRSIHDHNNALLWTLRCVSPCIRPGSLDDLQRHLTTKAILQVQSAAHDDTVIELNIWAENEK